MAKRGRLEIIRDILKIVSDSHGGIKPTPLLRKSNVSTKRFKGYYNEILDRDLIKEIKDNGKLVLLTEKGSRFLLKYQTIVSFIDEFEL